MHKCQQGCVTRWGRGRCCAAGLEELRAPGSDFLLEQCEQQQTVITLPPIYRVWK